MSRLIVLGLVGLAGACATPQKRTAIIWAHEQRAAALRASGQYDDAAAEQRAAEREREKLAGGEQHIVARSEH